MNRTQISKNWLTDSAVWIELNDGRKASESFADYSRLAKANDEQRRNFVMSYFGLHWPDIDEDLSYDGFFAKYPDGIEAQDEVR